MQVTIKAGQTLIDIAMQYYSDAGMAFELALFMGVSLTDGLVSGSLLVLPDADPTITVQSIIRILNRNGNMPASDNGIEQNGGIGYMEISKDFKVS